MTLLKGKHILIVGVTSQSSIGFAVARICQEQGATVILTNYGKALRLTEKIAIRLPQQAAVIELDLTNCDHLKQLPERISQYCDALDGVVFCAAYANPETCLGNKFLSTSWSDAARALQISTYGLPALIQALGNQISKHAAIVGLTFDASKVWPGYDWMGVAKAALESANRYMANCLAHRRIRCNLVAAGPLNTLAKSAIPGNENWDAIWQQSAPLGWDPNDATNVAKTVCVLLSDWLPATTGEIIHADGGAFMLGNFGALQTPTDE